MTLNRKGIIVDSLKDGMNKYCSPLFAVESTPSTCSRLTRYDSSLLGITPAARLPPLLM